MLAAISTAAAAEVAPGTRSCGPRPPGDLASDLYPPRFPPMGLVKKQMAKGKTECPICFRVHPFTECGKALEAGYITEHNPKKAKAKFVALGLKGPRENQFGKHRTASSASAFSPALPPPPASHSLPPPPSPPSQAPSEDDDASVVEGGEGDNGGTGGGGRAGGKAEALLAVRGLPDCFSRGLSLSPRATNFALAFLGLCSVM